ncbi:uncharacterized protein LOC110024420 [Phalaenopsis equestris]|uniref:uncharacterized protein LOC110024420 n=1 Tax=Phalaenopsis equestris TaxID=78828 RepID=UPI0009E308E9|nr:uncharacterized protein LOC110024420 [Phalaenopsis equestris]XP_020580042.1 uncharacterized protein LOC110024420 [Phalaenopsis equestris]
MEMNKNSLDLLLVPFSIFINASYHFYLWHSSKSKKPKTSVGANLVSKRVWFQSIMQADSNKAVIGVQTFRNSLMSTILFASISITINAALASFANNLYTSSHLFAGHPTFGSQMEAILVLKYSSVSMFMLLSFLFNSMAAGFIIEANFLICLNEGEAFMAHAEEMMMKGVVLGVVGNRVLYVGLSLLVWMVGPLAFGLCTVGMLWGFYTLDFSVT